MTQYFESPLVVSDKEENWRELLMYVLFLY